MSAPLAASTLNRAAQLLVRVAPDGTVAAMLRRELAPRRDWPPRQRRAVAGAVAAFFRWLHWLDPAAPLPRRIEAAVQCQARFDAKLATVKPETLAARAVPAWIAAEMDIVPADWLRQLQREPVLWIRVRQKDAATLPAALGGCVPAPIPPVPAPRPATAFRYTGARDLFVTTPFQQGQFEIQDLASQLVGHACAPSAGETWWDAFAGEGGKTLHLADLMQNKGLIWASDRSARRLNILRKRAARGGVFNYRAVPWDGGPQPPTRTRFDGVLVDAPCSGVGTWQRHPHARWTASPADVRELAGVQQQALDHVAASVKPGGRLIYSVCTLTRAETRDVVSRFSALHPEFVPVAVFQQTAGRKSEVRCQTPDVENALPQESTSTR